MNDHDRIVEKILAGLRAGEAPSGMEDRLLRALRARVAGRERRHRPWFVPGLAAVTAVIALAFLLVRHPSHTDRHPARTSPSPPSQAVPQVSVHGQMPYSRRVYVHARRKPVGAAKLRLIPAGYPAPPLPLTGQEKLLLQAVRIPSARESPAFHPEVQGAQIAKERQDFEQFFHQSEGVNNEDR